jgi:CDP-glycerol glycerophosphotransferase (TagB/SpsB family)
LQKRTILYAPTWRMESDTKIFPFSDYSKELLLEFLVKHDAYLVIRPHHTESDYRTIDPTIEEKPQENRLIVLDHNALADVTEILSHIDILISDYSSIWVDFLLTNRPIILIPYDLEEFKKKQGLHYEIGSISPGPLIHNQKELELWMERYLLEPSIDNERRQFVKGLFHDHEDAGACDRIADIVRNHMVIDGEHAIVKK